jgi:putative transposase
VGLFTMIEDNLVIPFETGDMVFHILNRANQRARIFEHPGDYDAFERVVGRMLEWVPMHILAYCVMPSHWHFILWPQRDGDLQAFVHRLTTTHVRRWHLHRHTVGAGHLYQGTFTSFPVESDEHLLTVCRYVERNPVRAGLVDRAESWAWGSARVRLLKPPQPRPFDLAAWPIAVPDDWEQCVNAPLTDADLDACRLSVTRGRPFGGPVWQAHTARQLGLDATLRPRGRPRRTPPAE